MKWYVGNKWHITAYHASLHEIGEIKEDFVHFSARSNSCQVIMAKLLGMTTARYWTGNDAWRYRHSLSYRLRARFINLFFDTHYFLGQHLADCVKAKRKIVRDIKTPLMYAEVPERIEHIRPTIAYYNCDNTFPGRYGLDVIRRLKNDLRTGQDVAWFNIKPNSYTQEEMAILYPVIDIMLRPSRWDGHQPWMVGEALHFGCRCISTYATDPRVVRCDPDNYPDLLEKVREEIRLFKKISHPDNGKLVNVT